MKNKAYNIDSYSYRKGESIFVDANIWLYISAPPSAKSTSHLTSKYTGALKALLGAGAALITSSVIVSEYLNRYCRIEWNALHASTYPDFKKFRQSEQFKAVGARAAADAEQITQLCDARDDNFRACNISSILKEFAAGTLDFNDGMIAHFCREHQCKLATHDADFTEGGIEVLTGNVRLLAACT